MGNQYIIQTMSMCRSYIYQSHVSLILTSNSNSKTFTGIYILTLLALAASRYNNKPLKKHHSSLNGDGTLEMALENKCPDDSCNKKLRGNQTP